MSADAVDQRITSRARRAGLCSSLFIMDVVSLCPLQVGSVIWQPRSAAWVLTVVCKATYQLHPGTATLAQDQEVPHESDNHWNDDAERSLHTVSDLVPVKPRVDVLLVGHAFAPRKVPVRSLIARLAVGEIDKSIEVFCDRTFAMDGQLREGQRFARMALSYERAARGPEGWNPVGMHRDAVEGYRNRSVPNLQPVGTSVGSPSDHIAPAGFGPIAASWPLRQERLGPVAARWDFASWQNGPLPEGMNLSYFNAAPPDQQVHALRDDEQITLENLNLEHPRLVTRLPGIRPRATVELSGGATRALSMRADTLWIDTDRGICTVTWRGQLPLEHPQMRGRVSIAMDQPGQAHAEASLHRSHFSSPATLDLGAEAALLSDGLEEDENPLVGTQIGGSRLAAPELPFAAPGALSSLASRADRRAEPAPMRAAHDEDENPLVDTLVAELRGGSPVLPFAASAAAQGGDASAQVAPAWNVASAPAAIDPLAQSASSWGVAASAPEASHLPSFPAVVALPLPAPPPRRPLAPSSWEVTSPALLSTPALVVSAAAIDSPWVAGSSGPPRETIGMAAAAGSLALVDPKYEPLPAEKAAVDSQPRAVQLLSFNPASVARIRRVPRWKQLLEDLAEEPVNRDLDEGGGAGEPWEIEDQREVFEVLARGALSDAKGIEEALAAARTAGGKLVAPLVLVEGELEVHFDELEALKAAATTAAPLITAADEGLRSAIEAADKFLARQGLSATPAVCEGLHARIREAFVRERKVLPGDYLDRQVERALLSGRHYQTREVLGGTFLRALLWIIGERDAVLAYVPEELGKKLPMYRRVAVRVIAEVQPQQDQFEMGAVALKVLAVGRLS